MNQGQGGVMSGFKFIVGKYRMRRVLICLLLTCICIFSNTCAPQIPKDLTPRMVVGMWVMYAMTNQWREAEFYCTPHFISNDQEIMKMAIRHVHLEIVSPDELPKNKAQTAMYLKTMEEEQGMACTINGETARVTPPDFSGLSFILIRSNNKWMMDHLDGIPANWNLEDFRKAEKMGALD